MVETQPSSDNFEEKTKYTIYVEGFPYGVDEGDVNSHFSQCGEIKSIRLPRYNDSGRIRGYGHIEFSTENDYAMALKMDGGYLKNRYLKIRAAETPKVALNAIKNQNVKKIKGCRTVFLKHLPYEVDEDSIRDALKSCGNILNVRLPMWSHTKKMKGFGYIEFESEDEACAAVRRSGMKINNRMILINLETGAPKASFRGTDGRHWKRKLSSGTSQEMLKRNR